ncbi:Pyruvate formate-lyase 1-activating enzyme [Frankliniella fusca]|uniref:Pyruvate formate-lyase 1-activating enzyme n=1 Tax=Frankliniella fusca TaxID=407009 RepID=A0AAE1LHG3_9NEOP|nr:Pyruvate formate-lyase 1-activating enzyme [Frankliniella fusca]
MVKVHEFETQSLLDTPPHSHCLFITFTLLVPCHNNRTWHDFSGDILVVEDLWTSRDWLLSVSHYTAEKGISLHRNFQWMQSLSRFFED